MTEWTKADDLADGELSVGCRPPEAGVGVGDALAKKGDLPHAPGVLAVQTRPIMSEPTPITTAAAALQRLEDLYVERSLAGPAGLLDDASYIDDLTDDLESTERLYVGLAVTEIATLRRELSGALVG